MVKLVVFDVDGTLITDAGDIRADAKSEILRCHDKGIQFAIASGRTPSGVWNVVKKYDLQGLIRYALCHNGALIQDFVSDKVFEAPNNFIRFQEASTIIHDLEIANIDTGGVYFITDAGMCPYKGVNHHARAEADKNNLKFLDSSKEFTKIYKIVISGDKDEIDVSNKLMPQEIKDKYAIYLASPNNLEICAKAADKGRGIVELADILHIDIKDVAAFGDSYNDLSMIKTAGFGVAMGNAELEVKQIANLITYDNNSDGIAYMLKELVN